MNMSPRNQCQEETIHKLVKPGRKIIQKLTEHLLCAMKWKHQFIHFRQSLDPVDLVFPFSRWQRAHAYEAWTNGLKCHNSQEKEKRIWIRSLQLQTHCFPTTPYFVYLLSSLYWHTLSCLCVPIKLCRSAEGPICTQSLYIPAVQGKFPSPLAQSTSWKCPCSSGVTRLLPVPFLHHSSTSTLMLLV